MEFIVCNNGETNIIFLHGWGADYKSFYFLKDVLQNQKLHFASLDGFGGTKPPTDPTIKGYANRLHSYITKNNLKNVILVGHSFGGRIAIEYASTHSILKLVLVDSAGLKPRVSIKKLYKTCKYKLYKWLVKNKILNAKHLNNFGSADYRSANIQMKEVLKSCLKYNQKNQLKKIKSKTLIIWGDKDTDTPLYMANTLHRGIKNSKLVVLKNCRHFCFLDNQYLFFKHLKQFIDLQ